MPTNKLESTFRRRVGQHRTPLDTDALWAEVEPRLPEKRRLASPLWMWLLLGIVALSGLYLLLPGQPTPPPPPPAMDDVPMAMTTPAETIREDVAPPPANVALATPTEAVASTPVRPRRLARELRPQPVASQGEGTTAVSLSTPSVAPAREVTPAATPLAMTFPGSVASSRQGFAFPPTPPQPSLAPASPPTKIKPGKRAYWTAEVGGIISLPLRSVSREVGATEERGLESLGLQGLIGYHLPGGLSVRTGLVTHRINTRLRSEIIEETTVPTEGVVRIIHHPDGSRSEQLGTVQVPGEQTTTTTYYNQVSSFDVPLLLGYRLADNRFGLTVEAGPVFNLSSGGTGHRQVTGDEFQSLNDGYYLKRRTGPGLLAGVSGEYRLNENKMLTAGLRVQTLAGGFENPATTTTKTAYSLLGIQVGYRVRI